MLRAIIVAALASAAAAASSPASADGDSDGCGEGVPPWGHLYLRFGAGGIQFYTSAFSSSFPCQALPLVLPAPPPGVLHPHHAPGLAAPLALVQPLFDLAIGGCIGGVGTREFFPPGVLKPCLILFPRREEHL